MQAIKGFVSKYHTLSSTSLKEFEYLFTEKHYKKNDVLYRNGETSSKLFIMVEGVARSVVIDKNGKERTRTILKHLPFFVISF